ncbi:MAG TPA: protease pro-enzyme activation domain-containing protein, partial [Candidatus Acidoferrales bacterium]|nr:protease pro-enzyme activation domain-containing protein [Candidatus Acidoferrales bacterium]
MRDSYRGAAAAMVLMLALSACGGGGSSLPTTDVTGSGSNNSGAAVGAPVKTAIAVPRTVGDLAFSDLGRRTANAQVSVVLTLQYNNEAQLEQFIAAQSGANGGHQFLTPAQFNARYAPTAQQEQAVVTALQQAGFTVTQRYANRTLVDATAPSSTVERFFSTQMHTVSQGKYGERFVNATAGAVPAAIASYVRTVSLSNLIVAETPLALAAAGMVPDARRTPKPTPTPKPTATPSATPTPTASPTGAPTSTPAPGCNGAAADAGPLSGSDGTYATGVAKAFDFPVQHGCNGAGYTAAIVIDDPVDTSYVATYLKSAGVTQTGTITNEAVNGGGSGDDPETDLDVQTISGLAPGANIIVYDEKELSDQDIENAYNQVLTDGKASAVNSSFGGCESSDPSFESATNSIAEQGAAEGVEFSASAGDTGSDECGSDNEKGVSAPAGDPYFTSVGGINFTQNSSTGALETVTAGDASCDGGVKDVCYGGGGVSTTVALPSWQSGIAGMITSGRNQPDISLPFDYVAVYTGGSWAEYLGTSWSSPASVALFIETDQLHGTKLGWLNQSLYSLFASTGYSDYY